MTRNQFTHLTCIILIFAGTQRANAHDDTLCFQNEENLESCRALAYYTDYQRVTCLRQQTIEDLSDKRDTCLSSTGYCWYAKCQKAALGGYGFFPVIREECRCEETSRDWCKHKIDHNKERCLKLPSYSTYQKVNCLDTIQVKLKAVLSGCPFPETHCWYSCQADRYGQADGKVQRDCQCYPSAAFQNSTQSWLFVLLLIVATFLILP